MTNLPQSLNWPDLRARLARYLTATLFNRLQQLPQDLTTLEADQVIEVSDALLEATRALNPLHRVLVHYMPRYLLELDPTPNQPHGEILSGSFIFADVSGFTALTELLARAGDAKGREIMNQIMNRLFSTVLDPIIASGGDMLIFVGDAALVYFPHEEQGEDLLKAVRAGLRMQRSIEPFKTVETEFGPCSLTMSIGIERGQAYAGVVGTDQRMELLVSGPGTFEAMRVEAMAQSGQVMVGQEGVKIAQAHFRLEDSLVIDDLGEQLGDYEITPPTRKRRGTMFFGRDVNELLETLQANLQRVERLAPFVPQDMLALLVSGDGRRKLQAEFRPVAVQFINVLGVEELAVEYGPTLATEIFQQYFTKVNQIVKQHEGIVSQIDAYSSGFFFLNTFGVPKAHEGTTLYAVSAALQMAKGLEQINEQFNLNPPLKQRGGITYGLTFNGEIGADYRRESVIAGPAVNRAARLMSKSQPGQVILDSAIWSHTRHAFVGEELPPVQLKGIDGEVVVINVRNIRQGTQLPALERPLLAREEELDQLSTAIQQLKREPQGTGWMVVGETGLGKTALMSALVQVAQETKIPLLIGNCQPYSKHMPLFSWIDLVVGWLDLNPDVSVGIQRDALHEKLNQLSLTDLDEDLASLLSLSAADDFQSSKDNARLSGSNLILELLEQISRQTPLLIVLEDIHWMDSESEQLLNQLLNELPDLPIMLILTGHEAKSHPTLTPMSLRPLPNQAVIGVAKRALKAEQLDDSLASWICQKAGGNSLYVQELCLALQQSNAIWLDNEANQIRWTGSIPTLPLTLHELLLSRLDRLPLTQQEVLKRCAVLGVTFNEELVVTLCQPQVNRAETCHALAEAVHLSFLTVDGVTYRFNHPLMQEAIYATLSYNQRQAWHAKVAEGLVSSQTHAEHHLEEIVHHYLRSSDHKKAAKFGLLAGDKAREQETYTGALEYYQQVLNLSDISIKQRQKATESQADVLALQGNYADAVAVYAQVVRLGSPTAIPKRAIMAGDLNELDNETFEAPYQSWAAGSRAWLLAQSGQSERALEIAQTALASAQGPSHTALSVLAQNLEYGKRLDAYQTWLQRFVTAVLLRGVSTIDLLDMPAQQALIINKLARQRKMSLAGLAKELEQPAEEVEAMLAELVEKGQVKQVTINQKTWYKAHFARKAKKKLSSDLWSALDL